MERNLRMGFDVGVTKYFSLGRITMEGIEAFKGHRATINFQNEWLTHSPFITIDPRSSMRSTM